MHQQNVCNTHKHVCFLFFCFFSEWPFFLCEVYSEKCDFPLTRGFAASGAEERQEKRIRGAKKKRLQRTQYSWYQKKGENKGSKKFGVHCKSFVGKKKLKQNFMCASQKFCWGQKNTIFWYHEYWVLCTPKISKIFRFLFEPLYYFIDSNRKTRQFRSL